MNPLPPELGAELDALASYFTDVSSRQIGFPVAYDLDYGPLRRFLDFALINCGDPWVEGDYQLNTKSQEIQAVDMVAYLFRTQKVWGYVTTGGTEANEFALLQARTALPDGIVYYSRATHSSVEKAVGKLRMRSYVVDCLPTGEMDLVSLERHVDRHPHLPVILVANAGTTMTGAIDDLRPIRSLLTGRQTFIHVDAAQAGLDLATYPPDERPGFDFGDGADSMMVTSKNLGIPVPCGMVLVSDSVRKYRGISTTYLNSSDTTLSNSRSGLAALAWFYALRMVGPEGLRQRARHSRELALYAQRRLADIGVSDTYLGPFSTKVTFPAALAHGIRGRWPVRRDGTIAHIVCRPRMDKDDIDEFVADLAKVRQLC